MAVAYQDHLMKEMALGDLSLANPIKRKKPTLTQALKQQEKQRKNAIKNTKSTIDTGTLWYTARMVLKISKIFFNILR